MNGWIDRLCVCVCIMIPWPIVLSLLTVCPAEDESWNLVTCFCRRPFAGRPMIECSECSTWIHLFCAKIRYIHVHVHILDGGKVSVCRFDPLESSRTPFFQLNFFSRVLKSIRIHFAGRKSYNCAIT